MNKVMFKDFLKLYTFEGPYGMEVYFENCPDIPIIIRRHSDDLENFQDYFEDWAVTEFYLSYSEIFGETVVAVSINPLEEHC